LQGLQTVIVEPWRYRIVSIDEARERTGLEPAELVQLPGVQELTRTFADGRQEDAALRVPVELASARSVPAPATNTVTTADVPAASEQGRNRQGMRKPVTRRQPLSLAVSRRLMFPS
jgi:hypothetical protein